MKITSFNTFDRLRMGSRGSMTDKPEGILCSHLVLKKFRTVVIHLAVTDVVFGALVQHLASGFVLYYSLENFRPKVLKKRR